MALRALLEPHVDRLWSLCGALLDDTEALLAVGSFQEKLRREVLGFSVDQAFGLQLYGALWAHLARRLDARPNDELTWVVPDLRDDASPAERLAASAPFARLCFCFQLLTGLPAARLAALVGAPEDQIRRARAMALFAATPGLVGEHDPDWTKACEAADDPPSARSHGESGRPSMRQSRVEALHAVRSLLADELFDRAPPGILDLVHPEERPPQVSARAAVPVRRIVLAMLLVTCGLIALFNGWQRQSDRSLLAHHDIAQAPGIWLDPGDSRSLHHAWVFNHTPEALRQVQRLERLGFRTLGAAVLTDAVPGTLTILEDDQGRRVTWQVLDVASTPGTNEQTVHGIALHRLEAHPTTAIAFRVHGITHIVSTADAEVDLPKLLARFLREGALTPP